MTIPTAEAYVVEDESSKKKKKKKKKVQTSDDPYVMAEATTTSSSSPKKPKKPKSERKPKSEKKKKSKKNDSSVRALAMPVLEASGFEPLLISEINAKHAKAGISQHKYAITGHESQIVTVEIPPGETLQGEPGSMMYLSEQVKMNVTCGTDWWGRCCGGESCCVLHFENHSSGAGIAALVTNSPLAKVVPIDMGSQAVGGTLIVQSGAYMASYGDVSIGYDCDCNFTRCCCGGMGLVRQKIEGTGTAFLGATGTIVQKVLEKGETMLIDTNCLLAYAQTCTFDLKKTGGIVNWIGGGEGFFNSSIEGPGLVVVQSMSMCVLLESLAADKIYRR